MLPRNKELSDFAKELRKNMTFEEKTLFENACRYIDKIVRTKTE